MLTGERAVPAVSQAVPTAMRPMRMTDRISPAIQALRETRPVAAFRNLRLPRSDRKACHKTGYVYAQACCEACGNRKAYSGSYTGTGAG